MAPSKVNGISVRSGLLFIGGLIVLSGHLFHVLQICLSQKLSREKRRPENSDELSACRA